MQQLPPRPPSQGYRPQDRAAKSGCETASPATALRRNNTAPRPTPPQPTRSPTPPDPTRSHPILALHPIPQSAERRLTIATPASVRPSTTSTTRSSRAAAASAIAMAAPRGAASSTATAEASSTRSRHRLPSSLTSASGPPCRDFHVPELLPPPPHATPPPLQHPTIAAPSRCRNLSSPQPP